MLSGWLGCRGERYSTFGTRRTNYYIPWKSVLVDFIRLGSGEFFFLPGIHHNKVTCNSFKTSQPQEVAPEEPDLPEAHAQNPPSGCSPGS